MFELSGGRCDPGDAPEGGEVGWLPRARAAAPVVATRKGIHEVDYPRAAGDPLVGAVGDVACGRLDFKTSGEIPP